MTIRRASLILPCHGLDDFPTHLGEQASAELLSAWTGLWHPALIATIGRLPGSHPADEPPDPASLEGELVVVPPPSRHRMPGDWCDRFRATAPQNPPPVETVESRPETVAAILAAASLDTNSVNADTAADFLALGFAYLQVELLTRAMRYSSVLDLQTFESAVVASAQAAIAGNRETAHDELSRAFDLLADARNHVYSVDFYVVDVTLLADSTLGESLRAKLAARSPTNLLIAGEQIEKLANDHPATLAELKLALEAGTATIVGGKYGRISPLYQSPEALLADLSRGQLAARTHLERDYEIFGQYDATFSPLLPEVLRGLGFCGALHTAFDGGQLARSNQRKTHWGGSTASSVEALSATPLDVSRPETWLKFAERVGNSLAHDHVATILLAGWPGTAGEYFDDLCRAARFGTVLGKLITLDEYFRVTREPDDWTTLYPCEYPTPPVGERGPNVLSSQIDKYRAGLTDAHRQIGAGLAAVAGLKAPGPEGSPASQVAINSWNSVSTQFVGVDPLATNHHRATATSGNPGELVPDILGCGFRALVPPVTVSPVALVEDLTLRNQRLEITINKKTGGIQSLKMHSDRSTRVSQRLVFHGLLGGTTTESQMVADRVAITRNDALIGEITSTGRIMNAKGKLLSKFTQRARVARGLLPVIVDVELEPQEMPDGNPWQSYFASRLAWMDEALTVRRGTEWGARETERENIESPEWVEIDDVAGKITCFALGLPLHRRPAANWLDTLLLVAGEERRQFQFALGLDMVFPSQVAAALLTSGQPYLAEMPGAASSPQGWFLYVGAKNTLLTHVEPLQAPATGVRLRLLETEGRDTRTNLAAFRPFTSARITDFRGTPIEVLSIHEGRTEFDIGAHRWIQIEAQWGEETRV